MRYIRSARSVEARRRSLALLFCLALAGCGRAAQPSPSPTPTVLYAPKPAATFFVHLLDSRRFDPDQLHGQAGELVKLVLIGDKSKHDLTSTSLNINLDVPAGQVEVIDVRLPAQPGSYDFWSGQPGDREAGMTGQFVVQPAASG